MSYMDDTIKHFFKRIKLSVTIGRVCADDWLNNPNEPLSILAIKGMSPEEVAKLRKDITAQEYFEFAEKASKFNGTKSEQLEKK